MQLWLHLSLDFDPNSFSFFMHLHHLAYRGQQFPGIILISRPLSHPCAIYISAETRASRATLITNPGGQHVVDLIYDDTETSNAEKMYKTTS